MKRRFPTLGAREQRGSRPRCVLLTEGPDAEVAARLTELVAPHAAVDPERHTWMPRGFGAPAEATLGNAASLLPAATREALTAWWLAARGRANTPNWDVAATATIEGREGLVLVEAKAHHGELGAGGQTTMNEANRARIQEAVAEADHALDATDGEWALRCDRHYQLANRFTWSGKLASLGVPVVLVYLGFLDAREMAGRRLLATTADWERAVRDHAEGIVPGRVWGGRIDVAGAPVIPLIRSMHLPLCEP